MLNFQHKNGCKGQIWIGIISKNDVTRSTICVENLISVSKTAQGWYYAALLIESTNHINELSK